MVHGPLLLVVLLLRCIRLVVGILLLLLMHRWLHVMCLLLVLSNGCIRRRWSSCAAVPANVLGDEEQDDEGKEGEEVLQVRQGFLRDKGESWSAKV